MPHDFAVSNYRMAWETILSRAPIPAITSIPCRQKASVPSRLPPPRSASSNPSTARTSGRGYPSIAGLSCARARKSRLRTVPMGRSVSRRCARSSARRSRPASEFLMARAHSRGMLSSTSPTKVSRLLRIVAGAAIAAVSPSAAASETNQNATRPPVGTNCPCNRISSFRHHGGAGAYQARRASRAPRRIERRSG
jgi:hypothetical protein